MRVAHALHSLYRRIPGSWRATCACGWETKEDHATKDSAREELDGHLWFVIAMEWNDPPAWPRVLLSCGHYVQVRRATPEEFCETCQKWCDRVYEVSA